MIGAHPPYPMFKEGDMLDANATFNLIQSAYDQDRVYKILSARIDDVEDAVNENFDTVKDDIETTQNSVVELEEKHDQDM